MFIRFDYTMDIEISTIQRNVGEHKRIIINVNYIFNPRTRTCFGMNVNIIIKTIWIPEWACDLTGLFEITLLSERGF